MRSRFAKTCSLLVALFIACGILIQDPGQAKAAASMYVSIPATIAGGDTVSILVNVNTGGQSANAFDATFTYPSGLFDPVRGTYSGSICTLPIVQPDPSGGTATISCGKPSGFSGTGTVATIVLKAIAAGTGSFGLSGCTVLANDGAGTDITGGCSGHSVTVLAPVVTPAPGSTPTPSPKPTPPPTAKPGSTPRPTATPIPGGPAQAADSPKPAPATPTPSVPATVTLPQSSPTPQGNEPQQTTPQTEKRSIGQAISDVLSSLRDAKSLGGNPSGIVAILATMIPFLLIVFGILFVGYRLYMLERRRRRTLDRLFELELAELAALEGKLDLLSEKGGNGRQKFKEEFESAKANILRQIKPDFGKPVDDKKEPPAAAKK